MMKADNPFVFDIKHVDIKEYGSQRVRLSKSTALKEYRSQRVRLSKSTAVCLITFRMDRHMLD